ncbi:hypothetical protein SAMN05421737_1073 [Shouchella lonarensis]|uniref:Uncharacterized protein n=1 Tax=Shouchella lonarensis TaxID=1464122 RepID=A0A1G6KEH7_9BACI|nr:hypothetical protein SAMN05421737_1073 [Shouchella lonarensis]
MVHTEGFVTPGGPLVGNGPVALLELYAPGVTSVLKLVPDGRIR